MRPQGNLTAVLSTAVLALAAASGPVGAQPSRPAELPANKWVPMNEPPAGVQMLGWDEVRYCPDLDGLLFYGAYRSFTSENQNAVWLYRFGENRWRLLHLNLFFCRDELASDGGHTTGCMVYDENRKVLVYKGLVSMSRNDRLRTWIFDPRALVGWDANPPAPVPKMLYDCASAYVPELKAGFRYGSGGGTWAYDAVVNRWTQLAPPSPGPASTADGVYDALRKRVLVFGGAAGEYSGKSFKTFNDLWAFDIAAKTWSKLEPKGPLPPPRAWPQMALSSSADVLLLTGGCSGERSPQGVLTTLRDTWVLNLASLEWQALPEAGAPGTNSHSNHLTYDAANDVFLCVANPSKSLRYGYNCGVWAFNYQDKSVARPQPPAPAPAPAYDLKALPPAEGQWVPVGSANGSVSAVGGWAFRPSLTAKGDELLLAFGEYEPLGKNFDALSAVFAFKYAGGQWTRLGKAAVSEPGIHAQAPSISADASGKPVLTYQAIKPWTPVQITVKRFDADWTSLAPVGSKAGVNPSHPVLAGGEGPLGLAWQQHPGGRAGLGVYVAENVNDNWKPVTGGAAGDDGALNADKVADTRGQYPSVMRDPQGRLIVAWQEQKAGHNGENATPERIHVRRFDGEEWTELARELPAGAPDSRALGFAMTLHRGEPVVAVCEGTDGGRASLGVYSWTGAEWVRLGGRLNVLGSEGGAFKPAIVSDGKAVFVAWPEFLPGRPPLLFVKKWDGSTWSLLGGPLNDQPGRGAAHTPVMVILGGKPVVAWTEHAVDSDVLRQLFVKMLK